MNKLHDFFFFFGWEMTSKPFVLTRGRQQLLIANCNNTREVQYR